MSDKKKDIQQQIDAYVKGRLSEDEITELWVEFAKNPELIEQLELEVGVRELLIEGVGEKQNKKPAKVHKLPDWTWHAVAAAVLVIVGLMQIFHQPTKTDLDQFVWLEIQADQLETADGVRAKEVIISEADSILNLGFHEFVSGNTDRALRLYDQVIDEYDYEPYGSKAYLNKGIVFYNDGDYPESIEAFDASLERVEDSKMIEEKAFWYKANALVNTDRLEEARKMAFKAYQMEGIFRKPAFLLIQKLNHDLGYPTAEALDN
jgi:tetratricopeptide (TPR) repeat protein